MANRGPFYLSVIENPTSSTWYKKTPMGKNTINGIMKNMKENSPLVDLCPDKKLTNHSARKTVVKKLKSCGVPKSEIKNITGHTTEQGLDDYDSGDEREQHAISNIIDFTRASPRKVLSKLQPNQLFTATTPVPAHQHEVVYNFNNCNVTLNVAGNNSSHSSQSGVCQQSSPKQYKPLRVLDSDSD